MKLDDRCATCNHQFEQHQNGLCWKCRVGKTKHPYKRKGAPA